MPLHRLALLAACLAFGPAAAFDLQGHRGARGLAPENTLAAFAKALDVGVSTLELDTVVTADERVVVGHDPRLNPNLVRDAAGRWLDAPAPAVRTLTLAELQRYDVGRYRPGSREAQAHPEMQPVDGARMPTLDAVFALAAARRAPVRFNVETKLNPDEPALAPEPEAFVRLVLEAAARAGVRDRITLQSFDWRTLVAARKLAPEVPTACLTIRRPNFDNLADGRWTAGLKLAEHGGSVPALVAAAGCTIWSPLFAELDAAQLADARRRGLQVIPWTVNEPAQIDAMLELGVDGLISDRPDRVREALARRGLPLPPRYAATSGG